MLGSVLVLGGTSVVIACVFIAGGAFAERADRSRSFENTYTTVGSHVAEFSYWFCRHVRRSVIGQEQRGSHAVRALGALTAVTATLVLPGLALVSSGSPSLEKQGLAFGIGGLLWGIVLEAAPLRERTYRLVNVYLIRIETWLCALLLCTGDVIVLGVSTFSDLGEPTFDAALAGAAFVAGADLVSTYIGFILCPWTVYPLADP